MAISGGQEDGEPMMDLNTTPLIDVMLVLLIMFIITIPIQTHAVKIDLPTPSDTPEPLVKPDKNRIFIDAGSQIYWNGTPINQAVMVQFLDQTMQLPREPQLEFEPAADAPYSTVDQVMAAIKSSGIGNMGFVGTENYAQFAAATRPADVGETGKP